MKVLKTKTAPPALKDLFTIGQTILWSTNTFDGRAHGRAYHTGTVVKINRVTLDVELRNGVRYRLNGEDLATALR